MFGASLPFRLQEKGLHKEFWGGVLGPQNSLCWISWHVFFAPEVTLKLLANWNPDVTHIFFQPLDTHEILAADKHTLWWGCWFEGLFAWWFRLSRCANTQPFLCNELGPSQAISGFVLPICLAFWAISGTFSQFQASSGIFWVILGCKAQRKNQFKLTKERLRIARLNWRRAEVQHERWKTLGEPLGGKLPLRAS